MSREKPYLLCWLEGGIDSLALWVVELKLWSTIIDVVEGWSGWTACVDGVVAGSNETGCGGVVKETAIGFLVVADEDGGD